MKYLLNIDKYYITTDYIIDFKKFYALLSTTGVTFIVFFFGLFFVGNPYLSLLIMCICSVYFCWNFFRLIQTNLSVLEIIAFAIIVSFLYYCSSTFVLFILLALKIILFLLALSLGVSVFYPKMLRFAEITFMSLLQTIFSLGLFLGVVKIYFFDASVFFTVNHNPEYPILFSNPPSSIYLLLKNHDVFNIQSNALFTLDFSSDTKLTEFAIQLGQSVHTKELFQYEYQLLCLDTSWLDLHLAFVFT